MSTFRSSIEAYQAYWIGGGPDSRPIFEPRDEQWPRRVRQGRAHTYMPEKESGFEIDDLGNGRSRPTDTYIEASSHPLHSRFAL